MVLFAKQARKNQWLESYFLTLPKSVTAEARYKHAAMFLLSKICTDVTEEIDLPKGLRADVSGILPNGRWVVLECKNFGSAASVYIDAVMQASSYADAINQPVFIGPFNGSCTLFTGSDDPALAMLHLFAGRLNVGFLAVNHAGDVQLVLRGQVLMSTREGLHSDFDSHFHYTTRNGSKQVQA